MQGVDPPGGVDVGGVVGHRVGDGEVGADPPLLVAASAQRVEDQPVPEQQVVGGHEPGRALAPPGGVHTGGVAEEGRAPRLVQGRPHRDAVAERVVDADGVLGEPVGGVAVGPPARVLQRLRQVPVVERQPGRHVVREQLVDEAVVERQPARLDRPAARAHPRPGHREAVRRQPEPLHERDVLGHPAVVVARHVTGVGVLDRAGNSREGVPDGGAAAVLGDRPLDLVRRRRGAPQEAGRERARLGRRVGCGSRPRAGHSGHAFTAPCMMPATSWRPARTKRMSSGIVESEAPASTRL